MGPQPIFTLWTIIALQAGRAQIWTFGYRFGPQFFFGPPCFSPENWKTCQKTGKLAGKNKLTCFPTIEGDGRLADDGRTVPATEAMGSSTEVFVGMSQMFLISEFIE
ncbi:unnamed protein product [Linum trigynum]|uniref:Secreted protein n=1 Tax=Linum trigynum TaxID=586398 RepID=A0AAV2DKY6_9ROSI